MGGTHSKLVLPSKFEYKRSCHQFKKHDANQNKLTDSKKYFLGMINSSTCIRFMLS